jgi:hypothetical protein
MNRARDANSGQSLLHFCYHGRGFNRSDPLKDLPHGKNRVHLDGTGNCDEASLSFLSDSIAGTDSFAITDLPHVWGRPVSAARRAISIVSWSVKITIDVPGSCRRISAAA